MWARVTAAAAGTLPAGLELPPSLTLLDLSANKLNGKARSPLLTLASCTYKRLACSVLKPCAAL